MRWLAGAWLTGALLVGCDSQATTPSATGTREPVSLLVFPEQLELQPRAIAILQVQADDPAGKPVGGATFSFQSDDPRLASVDDRGRVVALGPLGTTRIIVTSARLQRSVAVRVVAGPPVALTRVAGDAQRVIAGNALAEALVVRVTDAAANAVAGAPVRFAMAGVEDGFFETRTDGEGLARWQPPLPTTAGPLAIIVTLIAAGGESTPATVGFELVIEAARAALLRDVSPNPAKPAAAPSTPLSGAVRVTDLYGNPRRDEPIEWVAGRGCGALVASDATTDADGLAKVSVQPPARSPRTPCRLTARIDDGRLETAVSLH